MGVVVVIIVHSRDPDLVPPSSLVLSRPPTSSMSALLARGPSLGLHQGPASHNTSPAHIVIVVLSVGVLVVGCAFHRPSRVEMGADIKSRVIFHLISECGDVLGNGEWQKD